MQHRIESHRRGHEERRFVAGRLRAAAVCAPESLTEGVVTDMTDNDRNSGHTCTPLRDEQYSIADSSMGPLSAINQRHDFPRPALPRN